MVNIYLDDCRDAPEGFLLVKNAIDCQCMFSKYKSNVNILSLDHDLGENIEYIGTGYDVVKWLVYYFVMNDDNYFPKQIYLHTVNPVGRQNMYEMLMRYKPDDVKVYNGPMVYEGYKL